MENAILLSLIGITGTLAGVSLSGIISYRQKKLEFTHQIKKENYKLQLERLEELHELIYQLKVMCKVYATLSIDTVDNINTQESNNSDVKDYIKRLQAKAHDILVAIGRIELLQRIYLSEGKEAMVKLEIPIQQLMKTVTERNSNLEYGNQISTEEFARQMHKVGDTAVNASNEIRQLVETKIVNHLGSAKIT